MNQRWEIDLQSSQQPLLIKQANSLLRIWYKKRILRTRAAKFTNEWPCQAAFNAKSHGRLLRCSLSLEKPTSCAGRLNTKIDEVKWLRCWSSIIKLQIICSSNLPWIPCPNPKLNARVGWKLQLNRHTRKEFLHYYLAYDQFPDVFSIYFCILQFQKVVFVGTRDNQALILIKTKNTLYRQQAKLDPWPHLLSHRWPA